MLIALTVVIMLAVGYAFFLQGLLSGFCMLVNVLLAGLVAFNFWEPLAKALEQALGSGPAAGYEDFICLIALFAVTLLVLRMVTNSLARSDPDLPAAVQQGGAVLCGLVTGYLVAGFLVCAMQTLPLEENFLGFDARVGQGNGGLRRALPPDRVWLALVRRGSVGSLGAGGDGFDPRGYFELGYQRHRRFGEKRDAQRYAGEDIPTLHAEQ
jgi:hypothetical protein